MPLPSFPRWLKITGVLFLVLLVAAGGATLYINRLLRPDKLKPKLEAKLTKILHRSTTIGELKFHPLRGFIVTHLQVWEPSGNGAPRAFFSCDSLAAKVSFLTYLLDHRIDFHYIHLLSPTVTVAREEKGRTYNISDLIADITARAKTSAMEDDMKVHLEISEIEIESGLITWVDRSTPTHPFVMKDLDAVIHNVNVSSAPLHYEGSVRALLARGTWPVTFSGDYFLDRRTTEVMAVVDLSAVVTKKSRFSWPSEHTEPKLILEGSLVQGRQLTVTNARLRLPGVSATGQGTVDNILSSTTSLRLSAETTVDFNSQMPWLMHRLSSSAWRLDGRLESRLTISGRLPSPNFHVVMDGTPAALKLGTGVQKESGVPLTVEIQARESGAGVEIPAWTVSLPSVTVTGSASFESTTSYRISGVLPATGMALLKPYGRSLQQTRLQGTLAVTATLLVSPLGATYHALVDVEQGMFELAALKFSDINARTVVDNNRITVSSGAAVLNSHPMSVSIEVATWTTHPEMTLNARVSQLNLDALYSLFDQNNSSATARSEPLLRLLQGNIQVDRLIRDDSWIQNTLLTFRLFDVGARLGMAHGNAQLSFGPAFFKKEDKHTPLVLRALFFPLNVLKWVNRIPIPGFRSDAMGTLSVDQLTADASFQEGVMNLSRMDLKGPAFRMNMNGTVALADKQALALDAFMKFKGGAVGGILSVLPNVVNPLAYHFSITGTAPDPKMNLFKSVTPEQAKAAGLTEP